MAYTVKKRKLSMKYRDERDNVRTRSIEISDGNVITDDDITNMNEVSKSGIRSYWESVKQVDMGNSPSAESEVKDTGRCYFLMEDDTVSSFDIVDPHPDLFVSATGKNANVIKDYDDLSLLNGAENSLKFLIDDILAGRILLSDGETPHSYLNGKRI